MMSSERDSEISVDWGIYGVGVRVTFSLYTAYEHLPYFSCVDEGKRIFYAVMVALVS